MNRSTNIAPVSLSIFSASWPFPIESPAARAELDEEKRRAMYYEMQEIVNRDGGALIPMLSLGVPGSGTTAVLEFGYRELFDLENDPHEMKNLALDKTKQDDLLAMNDKLNRLIDSEVGKDDGSHLPDIDGVNWAFEQFDP